MSNPPRPRKMSSAPSARPAFRGPAPQSKSSAPASDPTPGVTAPLLDGSFFEPDPAQVAKQEKKSAPVQARAQAKSRQEAIQSVHMIRLLAPLIAQAMTQDASEEDQVKAFVDAAQSARDSALSCVGRWAVAPADEPWVVAALERTFMEYPGLAGLENLPGFVEGIPAHLPAPPPSWMPLSVAAPVALLQALGPVALAQMEFGMGRSTPDEDLASASRLLAEAGQDAVLELVDPAATSELRTAVFCAAVSHAGESLAHFWRAHGAQLELKATERTHAKQDVWNRAHPSGADLEPVFQAFREHAARLRRLARAARPKS